MELKVKIFNALGLIVTIFLAFGASSALAHHVDIIADARCETIDGTTDGVKTGEVCVFYKATPWVGCESEIHGPNSTGCGNPAIVVGFGNSGIPDVNGIFAPDPDA